MPNHFHPPLLPPYSYIPGGPWPHPLSNPAGHSYSPTPRPWPPPIDPTAWQLSPTYLRGLTLFDHGYYWEAHEAWESLWHAHGRTGPIASLLQSLILLAAAGVKVRQHQPHGIKSHARKAANRLDSLVDSISHPTSTAPLLGINLSALAATARRVESHPPSCSLDSSAPPNPVLGFFLFPEITR